MSKKKLAVVIGRFQPLHNGHIHLIETAQQLAEGVVVLIGSANSPRTPKNPFTYEERRQMFNEVFGITVLPFPLPDHLYSDHDWCHEVQGLIHDAFPEVEESEIVLVGHNKDESSYYLSLFPNWEVANIPGHIGKTDVIDATYIRNWYFKKPIDYAPRIVPQVTQDFLIRFAQTKDWEYVYNEKQFYDNYDASRFPRIENTADAVVLCGGNILLVKRRTEPGKGTWALPGGFVNPREFIEGGCIRELKEETRIGVDKRILKSSIKARKVFDAPGRSLRGRIITHAFLIPLTNQKELPKVRGGDDAERASWFPLHKFYDMESEMFEDHYHIACNMIGLV